MSSNDSKVKILVVEDEVLLAQDIIQRLTDMDYDVVGFAMTANSALELLEDNPNVGILLMDIMIKGDKDGIELAEIINQKYNIPFIFLTSNADTQVVERAKKVNPYSYMLKPFNDRQVGIAIELALLNFSKKSPERELLKTKSFEATENEVLQIKNCLFLKKESQFKRVSIDEITHIKADNNYTTVYTKSDHFIYSITMKKIEEQLPEKQFLRSHRSFIVNVESINGFEGNNLFIGEHTVPVSKTYKDPIYKLFHTF